MIGIAACTPHIGALIASELCMVRLRGRVVVSASDGACGFVDGGHRVVGSGNGSAVDGKNGAYDGGSHDMETVSAIATAYLCV